MTHYDLSTYANISHVISDNEYAKNKGLSVKKQGDYYIIKYNKYLLKNNNLLGLFRSIITDGNTLLAFSPPKSVCATSFIKQFPVDGAKLEEFVEGTMINCFYHNNKWNIATRWNIGAENSFYKNNNSLTFREMFLEAMTECNLSFDQLDRRHCYSFVLQHPQNRIVVRFLKPCLVIIGVYKCTEWCAEEVSSHGLCIRAPKVYPLSPHQTWEELLKPFKGLEMDYTILGIIIKHSGCRSKIRNANYEKVKYLKGNSPKIQFQYYNLYQQGSVKEFLKYFPEYKQSFWHFREELCKWTDTLYQLYKDCYIHKKISQSDVPYVFRPHIWTLHNIYMLQLRENKLFINKKKVIEYIKQLAPARLMYAINYPLRKSAEDKVYIVN